MNRLLETRLASRWPEIFRGRGRPISESLMAFGCDHGDGWFALLDALCETLTNHARARGRLPPEAIQIKEKYATLRFYIGAGGDDFDDGAISMAEDLSGRICEVSGLPGRECVRRGWYATRAPDIAVREDYEVLERERGRPLPPVPTPEAARILKTAWPNVIRGTPEIPPGWFDVVDVLASRLANKFDREKASVSRILSLGAADGVLAVTVDTVRERDLGAVAMSVAMSRRTDPSTGASLMP
jgi:hypothetical protein